MQIQPYNASDAEQSLLPATPTLITMPARAGQEPEMPPNALDVHNLIDVLRRRWIWIVAPIVLALAIGIINLKMHHPLYSASAVIDILIPEQAQANPNDIQPVRKIESLAANSSIGDQKRLLTSARLHAEAVAMLPEDIRRIDRERGMKVSVEQSEGVDGAITVMVTTVTAKAATALANGLVDALIKNDLAESRRTDTATLDYIQHELTNVGGDLQTARQEMVQFKVMHEVSGTNQILDQNITQLAQMREETGQVARSAAVAQSVKKALADRLRAESRVTLAEETEQQNPLRDKLDAYIDDLETRRLELRAEYTPDSPEVKLIESQIRDTQARRARLPLTRSSEQKHIANPIYQRLQEQYLAAVSDAETQQARLAALNREIPRVSARLSESAPAEVQSAGMANRVKQLETTYELLSDSYQKRRLNAASQISNIRVLSQAIENLSPVNQNLPRVLLLSLVMGLLLAVSLTMLRETFDRRIHTKGTLGHLSYRPVLVQIPQIPQMPQGGIQYNGKMIEMSPLLEQMRLLRSMLIRAQHESGFRVFGITSPGMREGKSTIAFNLALTMAMDGKRVILIDADLRHPTLHTFLGLPNEHGMTSVLHGDSTLDDVLITTSIPNLSLLPAGPAVPNSPELLSAPATHRLVTQLAESADIVIVDTPPAAILSDVLSLVPVIDGLLVVVSASQTSRDALQTTLHNLEQGGASLLGFVYNRARISTDIYQNYYYSGERGVMSTL